MSPRDWDAEFAEIAEVPETKEFYPGSSKVIRHPNRPDPKPVRVKDELEWDSNPRIMEHRGVSKEFFTTGQLAMALGGRKAVTIRKWEQNRTIPKAQFRTVSDDTRGKHRLYTREQVEGLIRIAREEGILDPSRSRKIGETNFVERARALFRKDQ
jgi:hypothetical protein